MTSWEAAFHTHLDERVEYELLLDGLAVHSVAVDAVASGRNIGCHHGLDAVACSSQQYQCLLNR